MGPACTPAATHHDSSVLAPVKAARAQPSHRQPAKSSAFAGHPLVVTSTPVSWGHTPGPLPTKRGTLGEWFTSKEKV